MIWVYILGCIYFVCYSVRYRFCLNNYQFAYVSYMLNPSDADSSVTEHICCNYKLSPMTHPVPFNKYRYSGKAFGIWGNLSLFYRCTGNKCFTNKSKRTTEQNNDKQQQQNILMHILRMPFCTNIYCKQPPVNANASEKQSDYHFHLKDVTQL